MYGNNCPTRIDIIYDVESSYNECPGVDLPGHDKLLNFEFRTLDRRWLYLDPYGDEIMTTEICERFFGVNQKPSVAVCLDDGELALASLQEEEGKWVLYVRSLKDWAETYCGGDSGSYRVPKAYLPMLNELRFAKRPFHMSVLPQGLFNFIDREFGYPGLAEFLIISLSLSSSAKLEIWGNCYRWVSNWEDQD
jgi:hypothetical protein